MQSLATVAHLISLQCKFSAVEEASSAASHLCMLLNFYASDEGPLLIVDYVCATGNALEMRRNGRDAIGFVIFNRGHLPTWCGALFHLTPGCGE